MHKMRQSFKTVEVILPVHHQTETEDFGKIKLTKFDICLNSFEVEKTPL